MKLFPGMICAALSLSGCAALSQTPSASLKIQQAYFAEVSASFVLLDAAGKYKDQCFARELDLQQPCRLVVQKLRDLAIRVKEVRDLTDLAISIGSLDSIAVATKKLQGLQAEINAGLSGTADAPSNSQAQPQALQPQAPSQAPPQFRTTPPEWSAPPDASRPTS